MQCVRSQDTRITLQMLGRVALSSLGSVILAQVFRNRMSYIENILHKWRPLGTTRELHSKHFGQLEDHLAPFVKVNL